jgi:nucleotide-binding universal stress UspA family protein
MSILLAVGEERLLARHVAVAHDLATTYGEPLVALHVISEENFEEHRESVKDLHGFEDVSFRQEQRTAARFARQMLERELGKFDDGTVETAGRIGDPASVIVSEAGSRDARFVVVGGRRRSPVGKAVFGSTTQSVLPNSDAPVVTAFAEQSEEA